MIGKGKKKEVNIWAIKKRGKGREEEKKLSNFKKKKEDKEWVRVKRKEGRKSRNKKE